MKEVTKLMINEFKIKELGYDFMSYSLKKGDIYTFHHLIIPNRRYINDILCSFEREYANKRTRKGKILIREEYTKRVKL